MSEKNSFFEKLPSFLFEFCFIFRDLAALGRYLSPDPYQIHILYLPSILPVGGPSVKEMAIENRAYPIGEVFYFTFHN